MISPGQFNCALCPSFLHRTLLSWKFRSNGVCSKERRKSPVSQTRETINSDSTVVWQRWTWRNNCSPSEGALSEGGRTLWTEGRIKCSCFDMTSVRRREKIKRIEEVIEGTRDQIAVQLNPHDTGRCRDNGWLLSVRILWPEPFWEGCLQRTNRAIWDKQCIRCTVNFDERTRKWSYIEKNWGDCENN